MRKDNDRRSAPSQGSVALRDEQPADPPGV